MSYYFVTNIYTFIFLDFNLCPFYSIWTYFPVTKRLKNKHLRTLERVLTYWLWLFLIFFFAHRKAGCRSQVTGAFYSKGHSDMVNKQNLMFFL